MNYMNFRLAEKTTLISLAKCFSDEEETMISLNRSNRQSENEAVSAVKQAFCELPVYEEIVGALINLNGTLSLNTICSIKVK